MLQPITIRAAGPAEAEAIWRLTVEAYLPERARLHPPSGVFRETVTDVQRAMDEGTVYVAQCEAALVGVLFLCAWVAAAWLNVRGQWVPGYRTTAPLTTLFLAVMLIMSIGGFIYALTPHGPHHH